MHRTVMRRIQALLVQVGAAALAVGAAAATLEVVLAASEARYRDEARRDNYLRERTLTTADFPYAEFVPHEIRGLRVPLPGAGRATVQILGDLTIRDVTRPTTWEGTAEFSGHTVRLQARIAFRFADFALTQLCVLRRGPHPPGSGPHPAPGVLVPPPSIPARSLPRPARRRFHA